MTKEYELTEDKEIGNAREIKAASFLINQGYEIVSAIDFDDKVFKIDIYASKLGKMYAFQVKGANVNKHWNMDWRHKLLLEMKKCGKDIYKYGIILVTEDIENRKYMLQWLK